ncbi:large ribosomal subunit protein uL4m [Phymastichus coffea]|uniref:large ribosomal subunit protein uL4m n=1 Tax=Phymastichus coffea TaxID=108790 RepID=UPI00273BA8FD|nr:large ribosomal subunit protein uL4m [Phymastichus coffea]
MQPRIDIIHENIQWQKLFQFVSYSNTKVRSEVRGGGRKPWPQKGLGKARHGSIRSPLWRKGGVVHGPRSPTPHFYMLPFYVRVIGLASIFSIKLAQDDLHLVSKLEFPNNESLFIKQLMKKRNWGPSVLFIDDNNIVSKNVAIATASLEEINIISVYGLNVYSLLKHDTVVITKAALEIIENKLLYQLHRIDSKNISKQFKM